MGEDRLRFFPRDLKPGDVWLRMDLWQSHRPIALILHVDVGEYATWLTWADLESGDVLVFTYPKNEMLGEILRTT